MDIPKALEYLIKDRNIPDKIFSELLEHLIAVWEKLDNYHFEMQLLPILETNRDKYFFLGPKIGFKKKLVTVSKIFSLQTLLRRYPEIPNYIGYEEEISPFTVDFLENEFSKRITSISSKLANFVTLEDEVNGLTANELINGLGILPEHIQFRSNYVKVTYDVDPNILRVPTIIDAFFYKGFMPKHIASSDFPKAWNWSSNSWGLSEFSHDNITNVQNVKVTVLDKPTIEGFSPFTDYTVNDSPELERVIKEIITQIGAHVALTDFITGDKDFISLNPIEFELFIAQLYQRQGLTASVTKQTRDGGFDIIVLKDSNNKEGLLVQVKKTKSTISIRLIRELFGARLLADDINLSHKMLVFVTTSKFSHVAKQVEKKLASEIELIDYLKLQEKMKQIKSIGIKDIVDKATYTRQRYGI